MPGRQKIVIFLIFILTDFFIFADVEKNNLYGKILDSMHPFYLEMSSYFEDPLKLGRKAVSNYCL
jgi:hypothetical protein